MSHSFTSSTNPKPSLWHRMQRSVGWASARTYAVPDYLENSIDEKRRHDLQLYHRRLRNIDRKYLIEGIGWLTDTDGTAYSGFMSGSIADNLDELHQQLQKFGSSSCRSMIHGFNVNMHSINEGLAPRLKFWTPPTTVEHLLLRILSHHWKDAAKRIRVALRQTQKQDPAPLRWDFPSKAGAIKAESLDVEINWIRNAPVLSTFLKSIDWPIYVSEPFAVRPVMDKVRIIDAAPAGSDYQSILIMRSSPLPLTSIKRRYEIAIKGLASKDVLDSQSYILLCVVLTVVKNDTMLYIEATTKRLDAMEMYSRRNPSSSKVQYLLHTQECHNYSARACRANAIIAKDLGKEIELPAACRVHYILHDDLQALHLDLNYLADRLDNSAIQIDRLKRLTMDQMDMFDKRRNRLIGILIAIYVPLAFTTSFFGMNIADHSTFSYWTNTTARHEDFNSSLPFESTGLDNVFFGSYLPIAEQNNYWGPPNITANGTSVNARVPTWFLDQNNITDLAETNYTFTWSTSDFSSDTVAYAADLLTAGWPSWQLNRNPNATANATSATWTQTSLPGAHTWRLQTFWIVAGSLVLGSIVVPIIAGVTIRFLARMSISHRKRFRAIVSVLWLTFWGLVASYNHKDPNTPAPVLLGLLALACAEPGLGASLFVYWGQTGWLSRATKPLVGIFMILHAPRMEFSSL
ncbi:unnamed protein product [Zymoseptoria tritici ST99CH_1E4]|uniref:Uncharacterized protein n=1 Tax=Zymoseptoria tritici ST99CH_1E4 TaxID=1276532 RepID=A0A2H1GC08_ZYMTR|nr:unnamed protein product [Zymoseptoria tritici ST99CH_1E4]